MNSGAKHAQAFHAEVYPRVTWMVKEYANTRQSSVNETHNSKTHVFKPVVIY